MKNHVVAAASALAVLSCIANAEGGHAAPVSIGIGVDPALPEPDKKLIPTVNVAKAEPWAEGATPTAGAGLTVTEFAAGLDHPRWICVLPNGDVLVAETNAPPTEDSAGPIRDFFMNHAMKKAGASVPSANRITLLRDSDHDGRAEFRAIFMAGLNSPFGMALAGNTFYVANADGIVSAPYKSGATSITTPPKDVFGLPGKPRNHHWTKNIVVTPDGKTMYASVGSNSNVAEHGMAIEEGRAAIWKIDLASGEGRVFATGLRNPVGMDFDANGVLYTVVNERDELGDNLVPDYLTSVKDGAFYGWPYSYYGDHVDARVKPQNPELAAKAIPPDYALGSHTASLGLVIAKGDEAGAAGAFGHGAFIGQHGSWNRDPYSGYKVIFVPFTDGRPQGEPVEILTGFLDPEKDVAHGRPVGVAIDREGNLLVADDVGNRIWRVSK